MNKVYRIDIVYLILNVYPHEILQEHLPAYHWKVKQIFNFAERNHISLNLEIQKQSRSYSSNKYWENFIYLSLTTTALALTSLLLTTKYIFEIAKLYNKAKKKFNRAPKLRGYEKQKEEMQYIKD